MPETETAFEGTVEYSQHLQPDGSLHEDSDADLLEESIWRELYRSMIRCRQFDRKALKLQRQGSLGTYAPFQGQEATQVAAVQALNPEDRIVPSYREMAMCLDRGIPARDLLLFWAGDEAGHRSFRDHFVYPVSIPVGSQPLHGVGAARAARYKDEDWLAVVCFGDGATSEGDMLEAMNFAAVWEVPVLFLCQNNQWAISVPRDRQTASETLAQKALGFGMEGEQVDGNDPLAVHTSVKQARQYCLEESKPYFLEALTYRLGDHTTADDSSRYRDDEEWEAWDRKDPLTRTRKYLESTFGWSESDQHQVEADVQEWLDAEVQAFRDESPPEPVEMVDSLYDEMPPDLVRQRRQIQEAGDDG